MKITVIAGQIHRYENGNRITVHHGDTVNVPDAEGAKFVRLGVAIESDEPAPQPVGEPPEHFDESEEPEQP